MLDFICTGSVEHRETRGKRNENEENILVNSGIRLELITLLFESNLDPLQNELAGIDENSRFKAKSRKYQGVFEVKSRVKTWQVRGIWSQQLEH